MRAYRAYCRGVDQAADLDAFNERLIAALRSSLGMECPPGMRLPVVTALERAIADREWVTRAQALTEWLAIADQLTSLAAQARLDAIREGRRGGASYNDVATVLGVTKARAQQLCKGLPKGPVAPTDS